MSSLPLTLGRALPTDRTRDLTILAGLVGGYYLGEYFHRPWLGLLGLLGGVFLGFFRLILELRNFVKANQ